MPENNDTRIAYSARCTWWDDIYKVGTIQFPEIAIKGGLPCCPFCKSPLFEIESIEEWNRQVEEYAQIKDDEFYVEFIKWLRGKCFPNYEIARSEFARRGTDAQRT